jgi:hypothetical protein
MLKEGRKEKMRLDERIDAVPDLISENSSPGQHLLANVKHEA